MSKAILYSGNKLCHSKFLLRVSFVRKQLSSWRRVCKKTWPQCNTPTELQLHERTSGWCECSIMWLQSTSKHFSFILFVQTVSSTMLASLQQHCSWEPLNHWGPIENALTWNICNSSSLHEVLCVHTNTVCTAGHSWSRIRDKRNPLLNV